MLFFVSKNLTLVIVVAVVVTAVATAVAVTGVFICVVAGVFICVVNAIVVTIHCVLGLISRQRLGLDVNALPTGINGLNKAKLIKITRRHAPKGSLQAKHDHSLKKYINKKNRYPAETQRSTFTPFFYYIIFTSNNRIMLKKKTNLRKTRVVNVNMHHLN